MQEMATCSSILAWEIPWTEELGGYSPWGHKEWDMTEQLTHFHVHCHSTTSSSVVPFSSRPQSFPASRSFQ